MAANPQQASRPLRLLYPRELIDRQVARLQRDLRRLYGRFRRGEITREEAWVEGEAAIKGSFAQAQADVAAYMQKHGVVWRGNFREIQQGLVDTLVSWRGIVDDF
jgi:hypothetical protein